MSAAASSTSRLANSPASGGGFDRPQVAITIGLEWRLPPARAIQTVQPGTIVENKRLGAALALVKEQQAAYPPRRCRHHPARQRPPNNLEAPGMPTKSRLSRREAAAALAGQPVLERG